MAHNPGTRIVTAMQKIIFDSSLNMRTGEGLINDNYAPWRGDSTPCYLGSQKQLTARNLEAGPGVHI